MDQGYYYVIPAKLFESGDHIKALLYGVIANLCNQEGYCWASNDYLAKKIGRKDKSIVSNKIAELSSEGWILSEVDQSKGNKRKIYLSTPNGNFPKGSKEITNDPSLVISKESIITDSIKKESLEKNKKFGELMDTFKLVNPMHSRLFSNKTQRAALQELVDRFGESEVKNMIIAAGACHGQPYAPTITTPIELSNKLGALTAFLKKNTVSRVAEI